MDNAPERLGQLIGILLIGIWAYMTWFGIRARQRQRQGYCARCGAPEPTKTVGRGVLCTPCAARTSRDNRLGYRFFLGIGILGGALMTFGTLMDVRAAAAIEARVVLLMFGVGVALPIALALWIRHQGRTMEDHPDSGR